jgi:hypothetical protein
MEDVNMAIRKLNELHFTQTGASLAGHYDAKELENACRLTIQARRQGIDVDRVSQGFNCFGAYLVDKQGERWSFQTDGTLASDSELDSITDWEGDLDSYEDD